MPITCPSCKTPALPGAIFCDNCGFDLRGVTAEDDRSPLASERPANQVSAELTCANCGYLNIAGSAFCENCGAQLPLRMPAQAHAPSPVHEPSAAASAGNPPAPDRSSMEDTVIGASKPRILVGGNPESIPGRLLIASLKTSIPIPAGNRTIVIGREDPVSGIFPDIDLDPHGGHDAGVGRRHAQLTLQEGQVYIEDLDSVNGTVVNKQKLLPRTPHPLKDGDEIRFGKLILVYTL